MPRFEDNTACYLASTSNSATISTNTSMLKPMVIFLARSRPLAATRGQGFDWGEFDRSRTVGRRGFRSGRGFFGFSFE